MPLHLIDHSCCRPSMKPPRVFPVNHSMPSSNSTCRMARRPSNSNQPPMNPRVQGGALAHRAGKMLPPRPPSPRPQPPAWVIPGSRSMTPSMSSWSALMSKKSKVSRQARVGVLVPSRLALVIEDVVPENSGERGNRSLMVCSGFSCSPLTRESLIASGQQTLTPGLVSRLRYP